MQPKITKLCNLLCVLLLMAMFAFHFLPAWEHGGETLTMMDYIWFPLDHEDLTAQFSAQYDGYRVEDLVFTSAVCLLLPIVALVLLIRDAEGCLPALCGLGGGVSVMVGMLSQPVYTAARSFLPYMITAGVLLVLSLAVLLPMLMQAVHRK